MRWQHALVRPRLRLRRAQQRPPRHLLLKRPLPLLRQLDNLESIEICSHSIDSRELESLREITWIDSLVLYSPAISDDSVPVLATNGHLRWIYLDGTQISDAGSRQLALALPNCSIKR